MDKSEPKKQPFLCRIGLHNSYKYMPKVGGHLGDSVACRRCGYGKGYDSWHIKPEDVQDSTRKQAAIEYGRVLCFYPSSLDPLMSMKAALNNITKSDKFSSVELEPFMLQIKSMEDRRESVKELTRRDNL